MITIIEHTKGIHGVRNTIA